MKELFLLPLIFTASLIANDVSVDENENPIEIDQVVNSETWCGSEVETTEIFTWVRHDENFWKYALELRVGGNYPSDSRIKKIYGSSIVYEIELIMRQCLYCFDGWINVGYLSQLGRVHDKHVHHDHKHKHKKTRFQLYPISFGLKHNFYLFNNFSLYAGLGASYSFIQGHFFSDNRRVRDQAWGGVIKGGLIYDCNCGIYFDFFTDYYFVGLKSHGDRINAGGFRWGFGMGLDF